VITHDSNGGHSDIWNYIDGLREDLGRAEERISQLEDTVREHQMAVPHPESQS
jgi:hypothetical protein